MSEHYIHAKSYKKYEEFLVKKKIFKYSKLMKGKNKIHVGYSIWLSTVPGI